METSKRPVSLILLDCDLISHFIANNMLNMLHSILAPHNCVVLDNVYDEVARNPFRVAFLDAEIKQNTIDRMPFPNQEMDIKQEYAKIKQNNYLIGDGERACMAVAKCQKNIIASSNFRDVAKYCDVNSIRHIGTLDILTIGYQRGILTEEQCDQFINTAITSNKAKFPLGVTAIKYYSAPDLSWFE